MMRPLALVALAATAATPGPWQGTETRRLASR